MLVWGEKYLNVLRKSEADRIKYPEFNSSYKFYEMKREDQQREWWRRHYLAFKIDREFYVDNIKPDSMQWHLYYHFEGVSPFMIHYTMFHQGIIALGSDEQRKKYLEKTKSLQVIGAYA